MDKDELIEQLEESGLDPKSIDKILNTMGGVVEKKEDKEEGIPQIRQLELALLTEKDPIVRSQIAAKIISLRLDF